MMKTGPLPLRPLRPPRRASAARQGPEGPKCPQVRPHVWGTSHRHWRNECPPSRRECVADAER